MGKSASLNTIYLESEEKYPLTDTTQLTNTNLDILNNAVKRYSDVLNAYQEDVTYKKENFDNGYPLLDLPELSDIYDSSNSKKFSKKIQSWKGVIISYTNKTFTAKLLDLDAGGTFEIGEFEKEDISPDDLNLLSEGAIFYWSVGHYMENGQSVKRSDIRFQRLITLDENDIENTKLNIERRYGNLKERKIDNR
ncbi:MAG TPA: hypothetical protein VIJ75_14410 [Hanamia sp.]